MEGQTQQKPTHGRTHTLRNIYMGRIYIRRGHTEDIHMERTYTWRNAHIKGHTRRATHVGT